MQLNKQFFKPFLSLIRSLVLRLQDTENIFFHSKIAKHRWLLRQIAKSHASSFIDRKVSNISVIENHLTSIRLNQPNGHVKGRCLASSIRTKKAYNFTRTYF